MCHPYISLTSSCSSSSPQSSFTPIKCPKVGRRTFGALYALLLFLVLGLIFFLLPPCPLPLPLPVSAEKGRRHLVREILRHMVAGGGGCDLGCGEMKLLGFVQSVSNFYSLLCTCIASSAISLYTIWNLIATRRVPFRGS